MGGGYFDPPLKQDHASESLIDNRYIAAKKHL